MGNAALPFQWKGTTRFTVKKDYEYIQENHDEEQQHEHHVIMKHTKQEDHDNHSNTIFEIGVQFAFKARDAKTTTRNNNHDTRHSSRLCLHQITTRSKDRINSSWCYYTTVYGSNGPGQTIDDGLHDQQPTSIHLWVRKNTRHTTKRQRRYTQRTSKSYSSQSWLNDCSTCTLLQQQQSRKCWATTPNTPRTGTHRQSTGWEQLRHDNVHEALSTTLDSTTCSMDVIHSDGYTSFQASLGFGLTLKSKPSPPTPYGRGCRSASGAPIVLSAEEKSPKQARLLNLP